MIDRDQFLARTRLEIETLEIWIRDEWLVPHRSEAGATFSDADVARARLINDLRQDLGVNDEAVPVVLHLIDQIHGLRRTLRALLDEARDQTKR
ncbi:chaperone modulator CbpM [Methylocapsa palsarum]|uniref:Chaperone modulatory protein CbpM n=1 Tax=Methylocapsa palsarum TaxID=1612308 RepID=A0A1I3VSE0_9HYPH|nr:chaperone modulator CbpM [Methylocapsa palsarum]SFJ98102.1 chaperone modulatory protein CbpM [Methylocapsa palsarum]